MNSWINTLISVTLKCFLYCFYWQDWRDFQRKKCINSTNYSFCESLIPGLCIYSCYKGYIPNLSVFPYRLVDCKIMHGVSLCINICNHLSKKLPGRLLLFPHYCILVNDLQRKLLLVDYNQSLATNSFTSNNKTIIKCQNFPHRYLVSVSFPAINTIPTDYQILAITKTFIVKCKNGFFSKTNSFQLDCSTKMCSKEGKQY